MTTSTTSRTPRQTPSWTPSRAVSRGRLTTGSGRFVVYLAACLFTCLLACLLFTSAASAVAPHTATTMNTVPAAAPASVTERAVVSAKRRREDRARGECSTLDSLCAVAPAPREVDAVSNARVDLIPDIDLNPLDDLGSAIAKAAADAWTAAMMAIWASGLFVLRIVLTYAEAFLTPDLSGDGPGREVYAFTLWMSGALATILVLVQLGTAAFKREGKSLARAVIGAAQFTLAYACWFGYCTVIVAACGALSKALMKSMLSIQTWPDFDPMKGIAAEDIADSGTATVLAFLGMFLWLAAIGHILVYLARAASLLMLAATGPIAAAGLVADSTRSWFWKSLRWFHAAAFTPVVMVLVLGIGVQFSNGVAASMADGAQKAIGTALPGVMLILISVVAPMALFKMLAFVDPGTPSGASFRQGMAAIGGIEGRLSGGGAGGSQASSADSNGRSSGEQSAEDATGDRFSKAAGGAGAGAAGGAGAGGVMAKAGPVGAGIAAGIGMVTKAGGMATSLMADQTNQAGVGHHTYGPDFSAMGGGGRGAGQSGTGSQSHPGGDDDVDGNGGPGGSGGSDDLGGGGGSQSGSAMPPMPPPPASPFADGAPGAPAAGPTPPSPAAGSPTGAPAAGGATGGGAAGGGAAGGAAAGGAAAIPIPPVV